MLRAKTKEPDTNAAKREQRPTATEVKQMRSVDEEQSECKVSQICDSCGDFVNGGYDGRTKASVRPRPCLQTSAVYREHRFSQGSQKRHFPLTLLELTFNTATTFQVEIASA